MSTSGLVFAQTPVFFEDIIEVITKWQAGIGGFCQTLYPRKGKKGGLLNRVNQCAAIHPDMVVELAKKFGDECGATLTFRAGDWMQHLSGDKLGGRAFDVLTVLTPNEAAALAPYGFCNSGKYRGAGDILAIGPDGLEENCIGYDNFLEFCLRWSIPGQVVLDLMTCYSGACRTRSFTLTTYREAGRADKRHSAKYSTVYLNRGYSLKDFVAELAFLTTVTVRPA